MLNEIFIYFINFITYKLNKNIFATLFYYYYFFFNFKFSNENQG